MYNIINKVFFLSAVDILLSGNTAQDAPSSPVSPNAFLIREFSLLLRDETRNQLTFSPVVYLPYFFAFILGRTLSMRSTVLIIFPVSGSFSVNQFFMSGGQSIGASVSAPAFQ